MINKKRIILTIISISIVGLSLLLLSFNKHNNVVETKSGPIAIMLETEPGVYTKSQSNNWPTDDEYVYDSEKSYCVNGSDLIWNINKLTIESSGPDKCYAYFKSVDSIPNEISEIILEYNGGKKSIERKDSPTFTAVEQDNKGMYAMYDDYGKSYYFRGAVDNNWVYFAGFYWRIVRINGDGSVKLIYTGKTGPQSSNESVIITGVGTQIKVDNETTTAFNTSRDNAEYIGYIYELNEHRGHEEDSAIKDFIDTWYEEHFLNTDYEEYLSDFVVCNDRGFQNNWEPVGLPSSSEGEQWSNAYGRIRPSSGAPTPTLICPNQEDAYTKSDNIKGNVKLKHPIGLLTVDEVTLAGAYKGNSNNTYYLYTNQDYWLVSPYYVSTNSAVGFFVRSIGYLDASLVSGTTVGVRPVVSLLSGISASGTGLWNDPYVVE